MLHVGFDLPCPPNVHNEGEGVYVTRTRYGTAQYGPRDESHIPLVLVEREHGQPHVGEDEILSKEVQQSEYLFRGNLRLLCQVFEGVVSLVSNKKLLSY